MNRVWSMWLDGTDSGRLHVIFDADTGGCRVETSEARQGDGPPLTVITGVNLSPVQLRRLMSALAEWPL